MTENTLRDQIQALTIETALKAHDQGFLLAIEHLEKAQIHVDPANQNWNSAIAALRLMFESLSQKPKPKKEMEE